MNRVNFEFYYSRFPNFGDMLNEYILQKLYYIHVERKLFTEADMVGIGSILDRLLDHGNIPDSDRESQKNAMCEKPIHIWGTGLMYRYRPEEQHFIRPVVVHAVRGELTRKTVSDILGKEVYCALGDPGILASRILPPQEKLYEFGIIPHFIDADNPVFEKMKNHYPNSVIVDVTADPETVLKQISACRRTFSTSLHGLIVSDSYGIPNCWCEASDKVLGAGYKFHDYFSSFGTDREPFDLRQGILPDSDNLFTMSFRKEHELGQQQRALIRSFPYVLLRQAFEKKAKDKVKRTLRKIRDRR